MVCLCLLTGPTRASSACLGNPVLMHWCKQLQPACGAARGYHKKAGIPLDVSTARSRFARTHSPCLTPQTCMRLPQAWSRHAGTRPAYQSCPCHQGAYTNIELRACLLQNLACLPAACIGARVAANARRAHLNQATGGTSFVALLDRGGSRVAACWLHQPWWRRTAFRVPPNCYTLCTCVFAHIKLLVSCCAHALLVRAPIMVLASFCAFR